VPAFSTAYLPEVNIVVGRLRRVAHHERSYTVGRLGNSSTNFFGGWECPGLMKLIQAACAGAVNSGPI